MKTKVCSKCRVDKRVDNFSVNMSKKDNINTVCKECDNIRRVKYSRTKRGLLESLYSGQRKRNTVDFSKAQFELWLFKHPLFESLYNNGLESGFVKDLKPSIDRIDDYKGYSFDNIQLMTWRENLDKAHRDMKNGVNNKQSKAVIKLSVNGIIIDRYNSIRLAARVNDVHQQNITKVCKGKIKTAGGYKGRYE